MVEVSMIPPMGENISDDNKTNLSNLVESTINAATNDGLDWWLSTTSGVSNGDVDDNSPLPFDANDGGLWTGHFVPPPPRPSFLDDAVTPDGVTTCDLCSWAWKDSSSLFSLDGTLEAPGELGWLLTLVIVSLISAVIGAVIMVTVLHWRRLKSSGSTNLCSLCAISPTNDSTNHITAIDNTQNFRMRERVPTPNSDGDKEPSTQSNNNSSMNNTNSNSNNGNGITSGGGVWSWLTSKKSTTNSIQLITPTNTTPAENHYTHMDEAASYAAVGDEALYAELDRESNCSPAYQNTAYTGSDTEPDAPISSAPSSAYYSDLSVTTVPERAYEVVGINNVVANNKMWIENSASDNKSNDSHRINSAIVTPVRLASINEAVTVQPSDYV